MNECQNCGANGVMLGPADSQTYYCHACKYSGDWSQPLTPEQDLRRNLRSIVESERKAWRDAR